MRLYFAGCESTTHLEPLLEHGVRHVMFSFATLSKRGQFLKLVNILDHYPDTHIFLDAGAFSLASTTNLDTYFATYKLFLQEHGHRFDYATELDCDEQATSTQIAAWRDTLAKVSTAPIVPVWHAARGIHAWDEYCDDPRFPHIAFGSRKSAGSSGIVTDTQARLQFIHRAHRLGKTVHGFAETKVLTTLKQTPYDTVTSTTWKAGERFGVIYIYEHNAFTIITKEQRKDARKKYKRYFTQIGCDFAKILADDTGEIRKANILAWKKISDRLATIQQYQKILHHDDTTDPTVLRPAHTPTRGVVVSTSRQPNRPDTPRGRPATQSGMERSGDTDVPTTSHTSPDGTSGSAPADGVSHTPHNTDLPTRTVDAAQRLPDTGDVSADAERGCADEKGIAGDSRTARICTSLSRRPLSRAS